MEFEDAEALVEVLAEHTQLSTHTQTHNHFTALLDSWMLGPNSQPILGYIRREYL